jgi:hypothetical protein
MIDRCVFLAMLLSFPVAACSDRESLWTGTISDSAGVTIVSNTDVGIWASGEEWTLEEEIRIGVVGGDPDYEFGDIRGIAVDSRERIFVLDGQARHVRVYSPEGVYEQTVGSPGEGPGEIQRAGRLLMGPGDTLLVPDLGNIRINRYASDGTNAGSHLINRPEGGFAADYRTTPSGLVAERFRLRVAGVPTGEDAIVLMGTDGGAADTLWRFPSAEVPNRGLSQVNAPRRSWDITEDTTLLLGDREQYRIGLYSEGRLDRIVVRPFEPREVGDRDKEAFDSGVRAFAGSSGFSPGAIEEALQRYDYSGSFPAFEAILAGPGSTIWVQPFRAPSELSDEELEAFTLRGFGAPECDIFDSAGRFLGVVTMPERFAPWLFRGDKVYGTWYDEHDLPYVVRLRIVGDLGVGAT